MGITDSWCEELLESLINSGIACQIIHQSKFTFINAVDVKVTINCISMLNDFEPDELLALQLAYTTKGIRFVQLWEDVWETKQGQVLNRVKSLAGQNIRLHGRKMTLMQLTKPEADAFLIDNHIQGPALARHKLGLLSGDELVAVATFSGTRLMKHKGRDYRSAELIRFATKGGYTITGGMSKLIRHFAKLVNSSDIMSYADRDWSTGDGYEAVGFKFEGLVQSSEIWYDCISKKRYFSHRLPKTVNNDLALNNSDSRFLKVFNTGNLKYILYL